MKPNDKEWEARVRRVLGGEYPQMVWKGCAEMTDDIRAMNTALCAARADAAAMRGKVAQSLDTILLLAEDSSVALTRAMEHMRAKIRVEDSR